MDSDPSIKCYFAVHRTLQITPLHSHENLKQIFVVHFLSDETETWKTS